MYIYLHLIKIVFEGDFLSMGLFSSLFKRKESKVQYNIGKHLHTDMHSHILPGIDDGSPDVATSIQLMQGMYDLGIRKFTGTPHIMADIHINDAQSINNAYELLKTALEDHPHLQNVMMSAEHMMDDGFDQKLRKDEILPLGNGYILIETAILNRVLNIDSIIFNLQTKNLKPILAHPERYQYWFRNYDEIHALKEKGVLMQLNALSLTGYYGKMEKESAIYILEQGLYDFIGTDLHHERHLKHLKNYVVDEQIASLLDNYIFKNDSLY